MKRKCAKVDPKNWRFADGLWKPRVEPSQRYRIGGGSRPTVADQFEQDQTTCMNPLGEEGGDRIACNVPTDRQTLPVVIGQLEERIQDY